MENTRIENLKNKLNSIELGPDVEYVMDEDNDICYSIEKNVAGKMMYVTLFTLIMENCDEYRYEEIQKTINFLNKGSNFGIYSGVYAEESAILKFTFNFWMGDGVDEEDMAEATVMALSCMKAAENFVKIITGVSRDEP